MRSSRGYRLPVKVSKPQRPVGVAILATLGVVGSLLTIAYTLIRILSLTRVTVEPNRQLAVLGAALVVGLVVLWVNWGFWEQIRWAWWFNLVLSLLSVASLIAGVRYIPEIVNLLSRLLPNVEAGQFTTGVLLSLLIGLAYHLIAVIYMISVHAAFGVGVKDERPLWERVQRH